MKTAESSDGCGFTTAEIGPKNMRLSIIKEMIPVADGRFVPDSRCHLGLFTLFQPSRLILPANEIGPDARDKSNALAIAKPSGCLNTGWNIG